MKRLVDWLECPKAMSNTDLAAKEAKAKAKKSGGAKKPASKPAAKVR